MGGTWLLRRYSKDEDEFVRRACSSPAVVTGEVTVARENVMEAAEYPRFRRCSVRMAAGGIVQIPGYRCTREFFLNGAEDSFACLVEIYLMACTGLREHSGGHPSPLRLECPGDPKTPREPKTPLEQRGNRHA